MAFFEPGRTYTWADPYKAPEVRPVFRCVVVADSPRDGQPRAFGFGNVATLEASGWHSTALTPDDWDRKWIEMDTEDRT